MRAAVALAVATAVVCSAAGAAGRETAEIRSAIFFYAWYGTPQVDGAYRHWQQRAHVPPLRIASAFYPARGLYSSSDVRVLTTQLRDIRAAGVDQVVVSWWGRGSAEDARLEQVAAAARALGLDVAAHVEPYAGRTPALVSEDLEHLARYGVRDVYVYAPEDAAAEDWAAVTHRFPSLRLFAQTALAGFAARGGFDGVYTYDILVYGSGKFARLCAQARRVGLLCAPSVGPGYDARRAVGDLRVKPRRRGATYDTMWRNALAARADRVTITSYNEWHEGTQIEPAARRRGYGSYDGAWGKPGRAAQRAYLERTAVWTKRLERLKRSG